MKKCSKCSETKDFNDFYKDKNAKNGYRAFCKKCDIKKASKWNKSNKDKHCTHQKEWRENNRQASREQRKKYISKNPLSAKAASLKFNYGITIEVYETLLKSQNNKCAICQKYDTFSGKTLCVDHCHKTGKIRGLLCTKCNSGIGLLGDDMESVKRALDYLMKSEE